jgi:hypothetical protein
MSNSGPTYQKTGYFMALASFLAVSLCSVSAQESAWRTIQVEPKVPADLIKVAKIEVGSVAVVPGVPFLAGNDWFNNVVIVVENVSTKKIVFISGQLRFPEIGDTTPENLAVLARLAAGRRSDADLARAKTVGDLRLIPPHISLAPGSQIVVPIVEPPHRIDALIEKKQALSSITQCVVGVNSIFFGDDTLWISGVYFGSDRATPGKHPRISREEFESYQREK